jgi:hypothetical protein
MVSQPKPPDPRRVAEAQTGANFMSSFANSILGNANEYTPYGNVTYNIGGYESVRDPASGKTYTVPRYNRTTTLDPAQQGLLNLQNLTAGNLGKLAVQQSGMLGGLLKQPLNTAGMQPWTALPKWNEAAFSKDRGRVEQALMDRWRRINEPAFRGRESELAGRGLTPGAEGYGSIADEFQRARTDATGQAIVAGGQEQSRLLGEQARIAEVNNALRGLQFGERQTLQSFPVNLITALLSGSQVNVPQAPGYRSTPISAAPIGEYMYDAYNANARRAANTNTGLFNLAGAVAGLPFGGVGSGLGGLASRSIV